MHDGDLGILTVLDEALCNHKAHIHQGVDGLTDSVFVIPDFVGDVFE